MAQETVVRLVSTGDEQGKGKGHVRYTLKRKKNRKGTTHNLKLKLFNPVVRKHTVYQEKKK